MKATLTNFCQFSIDGDDALSWLQNLITADVESQPHSSALGAALLTPQGKILFDFIVLKDINHKLILEVRAEIAQAFVQRLSMYKMRAKLNFGELSPVSISINELSGTWRDLRFSNPVWRSVGGNDKADRVEYDSLRILHGVAESGFDYPLNDVFPHDVNLDQIGGVGFRKGCYVG
ncbi:MAG: YgfZ/GcvT domain-containing protein, partial [Notoacmeibacter sp.]